VSTDVEALGAALAELMADPDRAREQGLAARTAARERYGLERFLAEWDEVLGKTVGAPAPREEVMA
jgi:glycosyltransferase involved in cell wall biosynthesis